jgi:bacterioferritin-associated ferredoxin
MTRCECLELSFESLEKRILAGETPEQAVEATGCGSLCTACIPDLREFLARNAPREAAAA